MFNRNFFDKIYCCFSFQYFNYKKGGHLIDIMSRLIKSDGLILIDSIPDSRRRHLYYNTISKKNINIKGYVKINL